MKRQKITREEILKKDHWTDIEIQSVEHPALEWVVPELLPEGYTILAGRPKVGKSILALQLAEAVAAGGMFLGRRVQKGKVLYLAVEDYVARLDRRMTEHQYKATGNIDFYMKWDYFDKGGFEKLQTVLKRGDYRLCVLDTFYRLISPKSSQNDSGEMTRIGTKLHMLTREQFVSAILSLDHTTKFSMQEENYDPLASISGSTAKAGIIDSVWSCVKSRSDKKLKMSVASRDSDELALDLHFDSLIKCWQLDDGEQDNTVNAQILKAMTTNVPITPTTIALTLGKQVPNISRGLSQLQVQGKIVQAGKQGREVLYIKVHPMVNSL